MANPIMQQTIPIVFKQILKDNVSGELIVKGQGSEKHLFFIEGSLVWAKSTAPEERLGQILYKSGKISAEQLKNIPALRKDENEKIGKTLVRHKIISHRDVFDALSLQVRAIALSLFSIDSGEWGFLKKLPELPENSRFKIKLPGIIKEGMNRTGHISFFENEFFYKRPRTDIIPVSVSKYLSEEEIRFYEELSNFGSMHVGRIIKKLNISGESFWKKINLFYLLNILEFDEVTGSFEDTEVAVQQKVVKIVREVVELCEALHANKIDYYGLLKIPRESTFEEIKTSYKILSDRYNPVSLNVTADINEKIKFVFMQIRKAYDILSDREKRSDYDREYFQQRVDDIPDDMDEIVEDEKSKDGESKQEAKKLFADAESLYKERKYMEAALLLEKIVELDGADISYRFLLGQAQTQIPLLRMQAEKTLLEVSRMDPQNAEPLYALGLLYKAGDMPKKAEVFFRKALEVDVGHTLAGKMLHEIADESEEKPQPVKVKKKSFRTFFGKK